MSDTSELRPSVGEGLSDEEARDRLVVHGPNRLVPEQHRRGVLAVLFRLVSDPMALLLLIAAPTYLVIGDHTDAVVTFVALVPIVAVGWALEARAEHTLEQLRRLTAPTVTVWREGRHCLIPADELVPGDLALVHEGDVVPADARFVEGTQLMLDESALTGESQPVAKTVDEDSAVWAGTTVLSGRAVVEVTVTGTTTRYGTIGALVAGIEAPRTPLQHAVSRLVRTLASIAAGFCLAVLIVELARGSGWGAAIIAAVSLAIAAIPEEFPMVYTLYLALGAWRLAQEQALVRRLTGVETLGSTTVICSDKTGTLTLGRLEVCDLATVDRVIESIADGTLPPAGATLAEAAVLACEPTPFDPLEKAIVGFAAAHGIDTDALHRSQLVVDYPFDHHDKYLTHVWRREGHTSVFAKGSVEGVLAHCHPTAEERRRAERLNHDLADRGMRVIAVAAGESDGATGHRSVDEAGLRFLGLVAFSDPLRPGVRDALDQCRAAGIRVIMITGDHPVTAHAVAEGLGLPHTDEAGSDILTTGDELDAADDERLREIVARTNVFARTRPEQKHRLVRALRANGEVVAMTGDGINDAPALREAHIGVAMGARGTEVARESAAMVLLDDNFATIVAAVRNGRRIVENLGRAFAYLVAFHPPLLIAALVVPLVGKPLLLLPIHLVVLELVVHPTVSLVFENDPSPTGLMAQPPVSPGEALQVRGLLMPLVRGLALSAAVVAGYLIRLAQHSPENQARAFGFAILLLGQAVLLLVERSHQRPLWRTDLPVTRTVLIVLGATIAAVPAAIYLAPLADLLKLAPFPARLWLPLCGAVAAATLWSEPVKAVRCRRT